MNNLTHKLLCLDLKEAKLAWATIINLFWLPRNELHLLICKSIDKIFKHIFILNKNVCKDCCSLKIWLCWKFSLRKWIYKNIKNKSLNLRYDISYHFRSLSLAFLFLFLLFDLSHCVLSLRNILYSRGLDYSPYAHDNQIFDTPSLRPNYLPYHSWPTYIHMSHLHSQIDI